MRFCGLIALVLGLVLAGCGHDNSAVVGTWSINAPDFGAMSFASDGTYEMMYVGDDDLIKGQYSISGNELDLKPDPDPRFHGEARGLVPNKMTITADSLTLEPFIPGEEKYPNADLSFLKSMTMQMTKFSSAEHMDPGARQKALDADAAARAAAPHRFRRMSDE